MNVVKKKFYAYFTDRLWTICFISVGFFTVLSLFGGMILFSVIYLPRLRLEGQFILRNANSRLYNMSLYLSDFVRLQMLDPQYRDILFTIDRLKGQKDAINTFIQTQEAQTVQRSLREALKKVPQAQEIFIFSATYPDWVLSSKGLISSSLDNVPASIKELHKNSESSTSSWMFLYSPVTLIPPLLETDSQGEKGSMEKTGVFRILYPFRDGLDGLSSGFIGMDIPNNVFFEPFLDLYSITGEHRYDDYRRVFQPFLIDFKINALIFPQQEGLIKTFVASDDKLFFELDASPLENIQKSLRVNSDFSKGVVFDDINNQNYHYQVIPFAIRNFSWSFGHVYRTWDAFLHFLTYDFSYLLFFLSLPASLYLIGLIFFTFKMKNYFCIFDRWLGTVVEKTKKQGLSEILAQENFPKEFSRGILKTFNKDAYSFVQRLASFEEKLNQDEKLLEDILKNIFEYSQETFELSSQGFGLDALEAIDIWRDLDQNLEIVLGDVQDQIRSFLDLRDHFQELRSSYLLFKNQKEKGMLHAAYDNTKKKQDYSLQEISEKALVFQAHILEEQKLVHNTFSALTNLKQSLAQLFRANSLVTEIATQTTMLSMNAAIESAHSEGFVGRNFSFVADQIRQLAEKAREHSQTIRKALDRMHLITVGSTSDMRMVEEGVEDALLGLSSFVQQHEALLVYQKHGHDIDEKLEVFLERVQKLLILLEDLHQVENAQVSLRDFMKGTPSFFHEIYSGLSITINDYRQWGVSSQRLLEELSSDGESITAID